MIGLESEYRHRTILKFSRAILILVTLGAVCRPFMIYLPPFVTALGVLNVIAASATYFVIRSGRFPRCEATLVLALCNLVTLPLYLITGGVNSQFSFFMPVLALVTALVGTARMAWALAGLFILLILVLIYAGEQVTDLTSYPYVADKTLARGAWLIVGVLVASYFGSYFRRAYDRQSVLLDKLATVDHLTGLLNRRGLEVRLAEELQRSTRSGQPLSVLMMDVDYFKQFNDRNGHAAGDECLIRVGRCLRRNTRAEDIVSRYGGEEFLLVLVNTDERQALIVAEKLRRALNEMPASSTGENISVTIGTVTTVANRSLDRMPASEQLIHHADEALYVGKANGRNRVEASKAVLGTVDYS